MNEEFYFLDDDYDGGYAKAIYKSNNPRIDICSKCDGRKISLTSNLQVEFKGKKKADYYWVPEHFIISKKMYEVLKDNDVSGFDVENITIVGTSKEVKTNFMNDELREMVITSECGYLRKLNGELFEKCSECGRVLEDMDGIVGIKIDKNDWDGSDIFLIKNFYGIPIVTRRVKELLENNRIKNIKFINVKEIEL